MHVKTKNQLFLSFLRYVSVGSEQCVVFFLYAGDMGVYQLYKLNIVMTMPGDMLILTIFLAKIVTLHYNKNVTATRSWIYFSGFRQILIMKYKEICQNSMFMFC